MCGEDCGCECNEQCADCRELTSEEIAEENQKQKDLLLDNLLKVVFISKPEGINIPYFTICSISGRLEDANKVLTDWIEANPIEE